MKCEDCKWWLKQDKDATGKAKDLYEHTSSSLPPYEAGFCIRFPPTIFSGTSRMAGWVVTRPDDFCGEHNKKG